MKTRLSVVLLLCILCAVVAFGSRTLFLQQDLDPRRWEEDILEFERQDESSAGQPVQVLFLGSSSIRRWDLERYFPRLETLNRGFGGSQIADSIYYFDRILSRHAPESIVLYAGDNDINAGKSSATVFADFKAFADKVHGRLPGAKLIYIGIKPSPRRWHLVGEMRRANRLIQDFSADRNWIEYLDIDAPMIGEDGRPRPELFVEDGLHLSQDGYRLWASLLLPLLTPE